MKTMQTGHVGQWAIFSGVPAFVLLTPRAGFTEDPKLDSKSQQVAPTAFADEKPKPVLNWGRRTARVTSFQPWISSISGKLGSAPWIGAPPETVALEPIPYLPSSSHTLPFQFFSTKEFPHV
jgi:hypothetical protein